MVVMAILSIVLATQSAHGVQADEFARASVETRRSVIASIQKEVGAAVPVSIRSLEILAPALNDSDAEVRKGAFSALGYLAMRRAMAAKRGESDPVPSEYKARWLPQVQAGLSDPDEQVRALALNSMTLLRSAAANDLQELLVHQYQTDTAALVRRQAIARLRELSLSADGIAALLAAVRDPNDAVKQQAALGLADHRPTGGAAVLVEALQAGVKEAGPRASLVTALGAYGPSAGRYEAVLRDLLVSDPDPGVRSEARRALTAVTK